MNEAAENVTPACGRDPRGRLCVGGGTCARGQRGACRELPALSEEVGVLSVALCPPASARMLCSARQGSRWCTRLQDD